MKTIEEARLELYQANKEWEKLVSESNMEKQQRTGKLVQKLTDRIATIRSLVEMQVNEKFKPLINKQEEQIKAIKKEMDEIRAETAKSAWLPVGTLVKEMKYKGYSLEPTPTGRRGVVAVYDGSQPLSLNLRRPPIGSLIIIHLKKDGSPSSAFTLIWDGYNLEHSHRYWKQIENEKQ